jgi:hypothetical protein
MARFIIDVNQHVYVDNNTGKPLAAQPTDDEGKALIAYTETEMDSLITDANIGKVIRYKGEDGRYVKGELYFVTDDAMSEQYFTLPDIDNPATDNDIRRGKKAISRDGKVITGSMDVGGGLNSAYFVQDRANVFSLFLLPIATNSDVVEKVQDKEIVIYG